MYQFQTPDFRHSISSGFAYHSSDSVDIMLNLPQLLVSYIYVDEKQGTYGMTRLCVHWESVSAISCAPSTLPGSIKVMLLSPAKLNDQPDVPWSLNLLAEIWEEENATAPEPISAMRYVLANGQTITFAFNRTIHRQWRRLVRFQDGALIPG